jgi:hypothetical protein
MCESGRCVVHLFSVKFVSSACKELISPLLKTEIEDGTGIGAEKKYYIKSALRTRGYEFFSLSLKFMLPPSRAADCRTLENVCLGLLPAV